MSLEDVYRAEEYENGIWSVVNETSWTGHMVLSSLGQKSAEFYADLMNEVYNQVMKDIENKGMDL